MASVDSLLCIFPFGFLKSLINSEGGSEKAHKLFPRLTLSLLTQVIILIGNKADLEAQRDVTYEEAKQFAEENGVFFSLELVHFLQSSGVKVIPQH